jgi:hypothetical protein
VQRGGVVRRAGQPGFEAGLRQGWEQILLPKQPGATAASASMPPTAATPPRGQDRPCPRPGPATAAGVVAQAVKAGRGIAKHPEGRLPARRWS